MNYQTDLLFSTLPPKIPQFITPLINAYKPYNSKSILQQNLFAEPYYGDFNKCSSVLLTHNPGASSVQLTGIGSPFHLIILNGTNTPSKNYFQIASGANFPNSATNNWIINLNSQFQNHITGIQNNQTSNKLFIRDLIPYHSTSFGLLDMKACSDYLYKYFFNQVIKASFQSDLYCSINQNKSKLSTIIHARGAVWKHPKMGLSVIGWNLIGEIYCNCFIYKADFKQITKICDFDKSVYPKNTFDHGIYIVVIVQVKRGASFGIYKNRNAPLLPINLQSVIFNYDTMTDPLMIDHNKEMDLFIDTIR